MFSSKTPRDLNHDPEPWSVGSPIDGMELRMPQEPTVPMEWTEYDPRPEYDHAQNNEPNPIIVDFREDPDLSYTLSELDPENIANPDWETWPVIWDATEEQRDHARRVLERLARA